MLFKGQSNRAIGRMETLIASAQHGLEHARRIHDAGSVPG